MDNITIEGIFAGIAAVIPLILVAIQTYGKHKLKVKSGEQMDALTVLFDVVKELNEVQGNVRPLRMVKAKAKSKSLLTRGRIKSLAIDCGLHTSEKSTGVDKPGTITPIISGGDAAARVEDN